MLGQVVHCVTEMIRWAAAVSWARDERLYWLDIVDLTLG
jgi:hypothetical protein